MKRLFLLSLLFVGMLSATPSLSDFETLMWNGKNPTTLSWEDAQRLQHFKERYLAGIERALSFREGESRIPKVLHFLWLGDRAFPRLSVENLRSWMAHHPGWKMKLWSDRPHESPCLGVEVYEIDDLRMNDLRGEYMAAKHDEERAALVTYTILEAEGGVVVDHQLECFKALDPFCSPYDFFASLAPTDAAAQGMPAVALSLHIVGARPHHPIVQASMEEVMRRWEKIEKKFPGKDKEAIHQRCCLRASYPLTVGVEESFKNPDQRLLIVPTRFFDASHKSDSLWAMKRVSDIHVMKEQKIFPALDVEKLKTIPRALRRGMIFTALSALILCTNTVTLALLLRRNKSS